MKNRNAKGVVAAGSLPTAQAGIEILRQGGNAIDAAVASAFAVSAGEPTVTSLGGAGIMMIYRADSETLEVCDFFANAPRMKTSEQPNLDFFGIDLDYGPTQQTFYAGRGSAAVPGVIPGLGTVHEKYGHLSFSDLLMPAIRQLEEGVELGPRQCAMCEFLEPILTRESVPKRWYSPNGTYLSNSGQFSLPELAHTLRQMQAVGWRPYYENVLVPEMLDAFGPHKGGLLTSRDFEDYAPIFRSPIQTELFGHQVYTVPSPAAGGPMIALMLNLLNHRALQSKSSDALASAFAAALETADESRMRNVSGQPLLSNTDLDAKFNARLTQLSGQETAPGGPPSTTHISVVDGDGNAVALTLSHGESNAYNIGNTGIMMNNFLGESDLLPQGFGTAETGVRLATMMSPTIAIGSNGEIIALGTGGANRIRSAILQCLWHLIAAQSTPRAAIDAPRLHYENGDLNLETFGRRKNLNTFIESIPNTVTLFTEPNLYFGGINCAVRDGAGVLDGAGDPRRGGVSLFA